jgi:hypothetical protein
MDDLAIIFNKNHQSPVIVGDGPINTFMFPWRAPPNRQNVYDAAQKII